jgi:hypothetical protein
MKHENLRILFFRTVTGEDGAVPCHKLLLAATIVFGRGIGLAGTQNRQRSHAHHSEATCHTRVPCGLRDQGVSNATWKGADCTIFFLDLSCVSSQIFSPLGLSSLMG